MSMMTAAFAALAALALGAPALPNSALPPEHTCNKAADSAETDTIQSAKHSFGESVLHRITSTRGDTLAPYPVDRMGVERAVCRTSVSPRASIAVFTAIHNPHARGGE
ncbi:hypothetical protein BJV74DRAFT_798108 [Russula compacta]|nr:hypothetical protein BJV74DRAFT_798108 [Russula compacta]